MTYAYLRVSTDKQDGQNQRVGKERYNLPDYAIKGYWLGED